MPPPELTLTVHSAEETQRVAARLAPLLRAGDVLCLMGDLGAGKTTWTRGLARGLGSPAPVSSPTFTLLHEYHGGRLPLIHADAYRLTDAAQAEEAGFGDYLEQSDGVMVLEWPERIAELLPPDFLGIRLADAGEDRRTITITPHGDRWVGGMSELRAAFTEETLC